MSQTTNMTAREGPSELGSGSSPLIARLSLLFFFLLLAEGVLRKWLLNGQEQILGFIRDPVLIFIYALYFLRLNLIPTWLKLYFFSAGTLTLFSLAHALYFSIPIEVTLLGLRAYVLYVPLAFIMSERLSHQDIRHFLKWSLLATIPISLLVLVQFNSPVASWINKGTTDDLASRFTVTLNIVRPYGPFTFAQAQNMYACMMTAVWLITLEKRRFYKIPPQLAACSGLAIFTMGALSGGRTYFGGAILIALAYLLAGITAPQARGGALRLTRLAVALVSFVFIFAFVFPKSFEAMSYRQAAAEKIEGSTIVRGFSTFGDFIQPMQSASFFGSGIGTGSNAALRLTGGPGFLYGENEWERIVNEMGPLTGLLVILARIAFTIWLCLYSVGVNRRTGDGSPLIMFGFCGYLTLIAQTTGQNQLLSFCWFSVGLTLSLSRLALSSHTKTSLSLGNAGVSAGVRPNRRVGWRKN